jgi:hypothetical protein
VCSTLLLHYIFPVVNFSPQMPRDAIPHLGIYLLLRYKFFQSLEGYIYRVLFDFTVTYHPRLVIGTRSSAGCCPSFEGTPQEIHRPLSYLGNLPDSAEVHSGHESTRGNLEFAISSLNNYAHMLVELLFHISRLLRTVEDLRQLRRLAPISRSHTNGAR